MAPAVKPTHPGILDLIRGFFGLARILTGIYPGWDPVLRLRLRAVEFGSGREFILILSSGILRERK